MMACFSNPSVTVGEDSFLIRANEVKARIKMGGHKSVLLTSADAIVPDSGTKTQKMPANGWWANYDLDIGNIDTIIQLKQLNSLSKSLVERR